jgi:3-oxoacyl-[acyl-carrier protein] reductase
VDLGIKNRVALVGGSTRGIGRACAEALSAEGARVAVCGRTPSDIRKTEAELKAGAKVVGLQADLATANGTAAFVNGAKDRLGPVEILVVNVGGPPAGELEDFDDAGWQQAVELTLMSAVRLCRAAAPDMKKSGWGRIVFLASITVKQVLENMVFSNTLRAGVNALAKTLSRKWAAHGITVNTVCPGYTLTGRVIDLARTMAKEKNTTEEEVLSRWKQAIHAGRLADPAEIAACVAFLASERASYINGASICVDGGWTSCLA